ncbi:uncharacterized protein C15orf39 homolog isoform X2 [Eublepharis macularius]|nr:uncharacterized protein C15orf39 homolog isoform X2 [Eublepharis macularius]XP_054858717.1 uncharacterized protein C15orf39 homolog isoform X2 [Eublepharis macularius]XP_054858718.1 uncharacterized protein C15orf39 homolog isoform X2 [Eublepharis macularius]
MAEKRHVEAAGAVVYSKLSRLETDPGHVLAASLCRSSVLPGHASDSHYSYKGTYFSYPLQCHETPEPSTHWSHAESYMRCADGAINHQLRPEKAHCMFHRHELEGLGTWIQNPSYDKNRDCMVGDTLATQEKWANYTGHADYIQQGWIQGYSMPHSARAPTGCPPLAVPKPVYRNHTYCADASCSPKGSVVSGTLAGSPSKRSADTEWAVPSSGHPVHASCGTAVPKKAPAAESGFLPLHQTWKDAVASFSPYHKAFENLQVAPSASLVGPNYPAGCNSQKSVPVEYARSPCKKAWSKLPPPASPLAAPQALIYQEGSSSCYPLPPYQLTSHEQILLYQQSVAEAENQKPLFASPACKSFNFPASEDPKLLSRSYFPSAPRNYYPGHLDGYYYRALGSPSVASPGLKTSRELESQQNSQPKAAFEQRNPVPSCSLTEKASRCGSLPSHKGAQDWHGADGAVKPASDSFQCQQAAPQNHAFPLPHPVERLPGCLNGYGQTQETIYGSGLCQMEKGHTREGGPSYAEKQSGVSSEDKKGDINIHKTPPSGTCIVVPDSPVASQDSCFKGDFLRARIPEGSGQRLQPSPEEERRDVKRADDPPPPSPPMPVIHNVFSLAPYREYLEGSVGSVQLLPSKEKSCKSAEGKSSPRPPSAGLSKMTEVLLDRGRETSGRKDQSGSCTTTEKESSDYAKPSKHYPACQHAPVSSQLGATGCASEPSKDDHVLDLSLKTEGSVDVPHVQRLAEKTEALERENGKRNGKDVKEGPAKGQEAIRDTNLTALQPPLRSSSGKNSNFQSSAAFLYKKFKILKSHAAGSGSAVQQNFFLFQSSSQIAILPNNSLQQGSEQAVTQQNSPPVWQSCQQVATQQNSLPVQQSCQQMATQQNSLPVQQSFRQMVTRQNSLPAPQVAQKKSAQPLQRKCLNIKQTDTSKLLPPTAPASSPALGEVSTSLPPSCESLTLQKSPKQYFTALHASVCSIISDSVSTSSPELLKEWLERAESEREPKQKAMGSAKAKNGSKASAAPKPSKSKEVWLAFKDMAVLLNQLLSQLETFLFTRNCPFPHVVRAGTIFIPIHVVKEKLFGNLSGPSVDHVLQDHKVELRPTTLSEEKLLRELELKSCTSRMLKLLALKQLPDIYPDLLDLYWHHCIKEQLGDPVEKIQDWDAEATQTEGSEAEEVTRCLQSTTHELGLGIRGKRKQGRKSESTPQGGSPAESHQAVDGPKSQGYSSSCKRNAALMETKGVSQEESASVVVRTKHFPLRSGAKRQFFQACRLSRTLQVKLSDRVARRTRSTSKGLHLRKSVVRIKFQNTLPETPGPPAHAGKKRKRPASLVLKSFQRGRTKGVRSSSLCPRYPELVGKRIRHLYEEKDKTEAWYQGVVLRVHKRHKDPLKTVYEVKYDSEPEWQYYLEILQDYKKGWLEVDE